MQRSVKTTGNTPAATEDAGAAAPPPQPRVDTTLVKGLNLLETLAFSRTPLGVTQLASMLGINKSNVHRLLRTLSIAGYIVQQPDRTYRANIKLWRLGNEVLQNLDLSAHAIDVMQELVDSCDESVHLAVLQGFEVVYVEKLESDQPVRAYTRKGGSAPIHCVATGKALLAYNYRRLRKAMSSRLEKMAPNTITTIEALDAEVEKILKTSLAFNLGEYREDVHGLAAPIHGPDGTVMAAIGISGPKSRLSAQRLRSLGPTVLKAADEISRRITGSEPTLPSKAGRGQGAGGR